MNNNMDQNGYSNREPENLNKFNWGAFMLNMIWGIGNKSYLTFLCLVPVLNVVWVFVCGFKGNQWAWDSGCFKTAEEFEATQATWNRAGIAYFVLMIVFFVLYFIFLGSLVALVASTMTM